MSDDIAGLSLEEVSRLAHTSGMRQVGTRPPFFRYARDLWRRREFLWTLASARSFAKNEGQRFGQFWAFANPLLLIATYLFIFGFILQLDREIDNFVGFLAIGVVLFGLSASTLTGGSRAILNNTGLVRALHFPRALLPLSAVLTEFLALVPGFIVLIIVLPLTGEVPAWSWFLFPVAIAIQALQQAGVVLILARIVNASADFWNLIPVAVRMLRYVSGVFFSISAMTAAMPALGTVLDYQPLALQLNLARQALMGEFELSLFPWLVGILWALILPTTGLLIFWRDEARYGRG